MSDSLLEVAAPSRLHFGLLSFGQPDRRQFGGCGVMIAAPGILLRFQPSDRLEAFGPMHERALHFARCFLAYHNFSGEPPFRLEVVRAARPHTGLGTGTSLALAVAAGLNMLLRLPDAGPKDLARSVGRGKRSAVGVHGFFRGGFIVEAGKRSGEELSPLVCRIELPAAWRFVLICPRQETGLCGEEESAAFGRLPPIPPEVTRRLWEELLRDLLPAARGQDFERFGESLFRYGHLAGQCFAGCQHGAYATRQTAELVKHIRRLGVRGVGQSSWGPTLFALLPDAAAAESFASQLRTIGHADDLEITLAAPNNQGARVGP